MYDIRQHTPCLPVFHQADRALPASERHAIPLSHRRSYRTWYASKSLPQKRVMPRKGCAQSSPSRFVTHRSEYVSPAPV